MLRLERQMEAFRNVLEDCQLSDLGFQRSKFTWCKNHTDHPFSREGLIEQWQILTVVGILRMWMFVSWLLAILTIDHY
jgi:hypothetical protein